MLFLGARGSRLSVQPEILAADRQITDYLFIEWQNIFYLKAVSHSLISKLFLIEIMPTLYRFRYHMTGAESRKVCVFSLTLVIGTQL